MGPVLYPRAVLSLVVLECRKRAVDRPGASGGRVKGEVTRPTVEGGRGMQRPYGIARVCRSSEGGHGVKVRGLPRRAQTGKHALSVGRTGAEVEGGGGNGEARNGAECGRGSESATSVELRCASSVSQPPCGGCVSHAECEGRCKRERRVSESFRLCRSAEPDTDANLREAASPLAFTCQSCRMRTVWT